MHLPSSQPPYLSPWPCHRLYYCGMPAAYHLSPHSLVWWLLANAAGLRLVVFGGKTTQKYQLDLASPAPSWLQLNRLRSSTHKCRRWHGPGQGAELEPLTQPRAVSSPLCALSRPMLLTYTHRCRRTASALPRHAAPHCQPVLIHTSSSSAHDSSLQVNFPFKHKAPTVNHCPRLGWFHSTVKLVAWSLLPSLLLLPLPLPLLLLPPARLRPGCLCALARCVVLGPVGHLALAAAKHQPGGRRVALAMSRSSGGGGLRPASKHRGNIRQDT